MKTFRSFASLAVCAALALGASWATPALAQTVVYTEDFQAYNAPGEPPGWFDSAPGNPSNEAPGQFKVWNDPLVAGNRAFGHKGGSESTSHYRVRTFAAADGFRLEGRWMRTKSKAHLGVTFLSDFPLRDEHYRLALTNDNGTVHLEGRGSGSANGDTESGVSIDLNTWYRFVVEVSKPGAGPTLELRAKVWKQSQSEPAAWQINATDDSGERLDGWVGVWGEGAGEKYWDDLNVRSSGAPPDTDPPVIQILESGVALQDGTAFNRVVTPTFQVVDASAVVVTATLNGAAFSSGTSLSSEGVYALVVNAVDAFGNSASRSVGFSIDRTAPVFGAIVPPSGSLTREGSVVLSGSVSGAISLTVDGAAVSLVGGSFVTSALFLGEGEGTFSLVAIDAAGNTTTVLHRIERDSLPPSISIVSPAALVVGTSPVEVSGSAIDPHLASVTVNGQPAVLAGSSFSKSVALVEGANSILVRAVDSLGNASELTRSLVLDTTPPSISITEAGAPFVDGSRFHRDVVPVIAASDSTDLTLIVRLDGSAFTSGSVVSEEGEHELSVEAIDAAGNRTARTIRFEIDRTPPVLGDFDPADGSLVNSTSITLRGRATGASSLTVNGQAASLESSGQFTSPTIALQEGENSLAVVAEDAAGNRTLATLRVTRDTIPPTLTITEPAEGAFVSGAELTVIGTASDPHLENIRVQGQLATIAAETFRRDQVALNPGSNTILVEARDGAGNTTRIERHVTLDGEPPVLRFLESNLEVQDGARFARAVAITIDVQDVTATTIEAMLDGAPYTAGTPISSEGTHTLSATATDAAGNRSSRAITFEIDVSAPVFESVRPAEGAVVSSNELTITGRVRGATTVTVDGTPATLAGDATVADFTSPVITLAEGSRTFALVATDAAGNTATRSLTIVRDGTAPTLAITQPAEGAVVGDSPIAVSGTASDPRLSTVTVNGVVATITNGSWTAAQVPLIEGENTLLVLAKDSAENQSEARRTVVLDTLAPEITILDPAAGTVVATSTIEVSGTVSDVHLDRLEVSGVVATVSNGTFRATVPLVEGIQTLTARATDSLGHFRETNVQVERRSTAPRVEIEVPAEGFRTSSATIEVRGSVEARAGITVTVAGVAAVVTGEQFVAAEVPLAEGENRLIARARDSLGNEGVHTRVVYRDSVAPTFVASEPITGSLAVPVETVFSLTFSEELGPVSVGAVRLLSSLSGGEGTFVELPIDVAPSNDLLSVRPRDPLAASARLRLEVTAGLKDLAGNALANPVVLEYRVIDATAPAAPQIVPSLPRQVCAQTLTVQGTAESSVALLLEGGVSSVSGRAAEDGSFSLVVSLASNVENRLRLYALDALGNRSEPASADVYQDCVAPAVISAERVGTTFVVALSEAIEATSAVGAVTLAGESGPIDGVLTLADGDRSLVFTPNAPLAETAVVELRVSTAVRDLAGNALEAEYGRQFGGGAGESFFAGTALDAETGRPLSGVRVLVEATNGFPLDSQPEQTTLADGRFQLAVPAGAHRVVFSRERWTSVLRIVATEAGQGVDVFDPRLTPRSTASTVGPSGGRVNSSGEEGSFLDVPAGALTAATSIAVTDLEEQALPAPLPLGWSPRGAAWVEASDAVSSATLSLAVNHPNGLSLEVVKLDEASLTWKSLGSTQVADGAVTVPFLPGNSGASAYAAVDADRGATAPPVAVVSAPLGGVTPSGQILTAAVVFNPEVVLPGQRSVATVTYGLGADPNVPSGTLLTLEVREELRLLDGSLRREEPYFADVAVYRTAEGATGTPRSRFGLKPSQAAELLPIELGREDVTVNVYGAGGGGGNVIGAGGGSVSSSQGDRLDVPVGALDVPTAVVIERRGFVDLPLALPSGLAVSDVVGVVRLDLGGRTLRLPAALTLNLGTAPPQQQGGLLLAVVDRGRGLVLTAVARIEPTAEGFTTTPIDSSDLAFEGVRRGGFYLFVKTPPLGFFRGTTFGINGVARGGIDVTAHDSNASTPRPWVQNSAEPSGRYVLPSVVGAVTVIARDAVDAIEVSSAIPTADARVDLDLQLQVVGPRLLSTTPVDGATAVPLGIEPTATFSEAVAPLSVDNAIALFEISGDGSERALDVTFEVQGSLVRVIPTATLAPDVQHELRIGTGVVDLQGNALENAAVISFRTALAPPSSETLDLTKVVLFEPDASGFARVVGRAGAVPAGTLLVVENASALATVPSVESNLDGSFEAAIAASVEHTILLHVLRPASNELIVELGPFRTADLKGAVIGPRGARFTTVDGYEIGVLEGTFSTLARVRLSPLTTGATEPTLPEGLTTAADFTLDFGGALADKPLEIALPRPLAATGDGPFLLLRRIDLNGAEGWMLHDLMRVEGAKLTTAEVVGVAGTSVGLARATHASPLQNHSEATSDLTTGAPKSDVGATGGSPFLLNVNSNPLAPNAAQRPKAYLPGSVFPGTYRIGAPAVPIAYAAASFPPGGGVTIAYSDWESIGASLDAAVSRHLAFDAVLLPVRIGRPIALVVKDLTSGVTLFEGEFGAPPPSGEITVLPVDAFGDTKPPFPQGGSPLQYFALSASPSEAEIARGVTVRFAGGTLTVTAVANALPPNVQARLLGLDATATTTANTTANGALSLSISAALGQRFILGIGAQLPSNAPLDVSWNEALASDVAGISVLDSAARDIHADVSLAGDGRTIHIQPPSGWRAGETYTLRLGGAVADAAGNRWEKTFDLSFKIQASEVLDTYPLDAVRDVARLGKWLFVAADRAGLLVLDASDPESLKNAVPGDVTFPFPLQDPVRAVAIDAHGRVLVAGGGVEGFGQLKIFDPLLFDPAAVAANPSDVSVRYAAFRGSAILSDPLGANPGTQLPEGTPRKITVLSNDETSRWTAGMPAPSHVTATFTLAPGSTTRGTLSVQGDGAAPNAPVSLRSKLGAQFNRVLADEDGEFTIELSVQKGDQVELLRNQQSLAYVATQGVGVEVVDVNSFFEQPEPTGPRSRDLLGIYSGYQDPNLALCNEAVSDLGAALIDLDGLFDTNNVHPLSLFGAVGNRGLAILESSPSSPGQVSFLADQCTEDPSNGGSRAIAAVEMLGQYGFDHDDDGSIEPSELSDYALVAHRTAGVLIYDVADRAHPLLVGSIRVSSASGITADREGRRLFVATAGEGLAIVDFDQIPTLDPVDQNGDGKDDRIVETIALPGNTNAPVFVVPELGLVFAGGLDRGVTSVAVGPSRLIAVDAFEVSRAIDVVAPYGVLARFATQAAAFRLVVDLAGIDANEVDFEIESVGPTGARISPAAPEGVFEELPPTHRTIKLKRQAENAYENGSLRYVSDPIVALADLRASRAWNRSSREAEGCVRCPAAADRPADAVEILSGDAIVARPSAALLAQLTELYGAERASSIRLEITSTRWDLSPSLRQESRLGANFGSGEAAPGTLLHSGEMTFDATDLAVASRGFDFVFTRTYRNQTVGSGPLGAGWDFGFRMRLREIGNGDVEYFDRRLRRETFKRKADGTFESPQGMFAVLSKNSSGFLLVEANHALIRFDSHGRLTSIADGLKDADDTGNQMTFEYDGASRLSAIVDTLERRYTLSYDIDGRLTTLRDFTGREVNYRYDLKGRLEEVELPRVTTGVAPGVSPRLTTYSYPSFSGDLATSWTSYDNLTSLQDPRGETPIEITYTDVDNDQRSDEATTQRWGAGTVTLTYDFDSKETRVADRRNHTTIYQQDNDGRALRREDPTGAIWTWAYDAEGLTTEAIRPLGGKTTISYDASASRRSRGNACVIEETADDRGPNGSPSTRKTEITYHGWSNEPTKLIEPRGTVTAIRRSTTGLALETRRAVGSPDQTTTTYTYNKQGQPLTATDPNGRKTKFEYFEDGPSKGYLKRTTRDLDGLALTISYQVDERGNPTSETDPRGVRTDFEWNEADWPVSTMVAATGSSDGASALRYATHFVHDAIGQRIEVQEPDGDDGSGTLKVRRTFGQLGELLETRREITSGGAESVMAYTYDENLNLIESRAPNGQTTSTTYDERDLPIEIQRGVGTPEAITETLAYNAEGQAISTTDGRANVWPIEYDGYGRAMKSMDPLGNATQVTYDANDNPLITISLDSASEKLAETHFEYDALDRRTKSMEMLWQNASEATSPRELLSSVQYDKVGNVLSSTDPLGRVTTYKYDTAHRALGMVDALGNETEAELDPQGNAKRSIRREKTPDGQTIEVIETATFDALGRPIEQRDPLNNTTTLTWDARSRLRRLTDPENAFTTRIYDGLDRLVRQERPEGIVEKWIYDESSRLVAYADAKDQTTTTSYDALNRPIEITWADETKRHMAYDASSNIIEERDPNGNVITQAHDAANRLLTRSIAKGVGVVGPTSETYAWDGLSRLKNATSGSMSVDYEYDSLSRVLMERQNGHEIHAQFDDASNRTQLVYPSGLAVGQRFDALDRPSAVFRVGPQGAEEGAATYRYRGVDLLAEQTVGAGTAARWQYDGARRPVGRTFDSSAGRSSLEERLTWTPRGQIGSITRKDLGGAGWLFAYDQASQLKARGTSGDAASLATPNSTVAPELVSALGQSETFEHDNAQNLTLRRDFGVGTVDEVSSPQDPTGRNRPSSVGGKSLAWDTNGNLLTKGDLRFEYDYRNRLARVTRFGQEIAAYDYDAFNRRMKRVVGDRTVTTTWNGWRAIEEQVDGSIDERWIYGLGLDEIVERQKADGAGGFDRTALVYASTGEPVVQITQDGKPIERYVQTALGERKVFVDSERPKPTQVAATPSSIEVGLSEQVREPETNVGASGLRAGTQGITLTNVATGETYDVTATLAGEPGPGLERRRLMLHVETPPTAGTQVRLQVSPAALEDFFANRADSASDWTLAWPASGMSVVEDTAQPELLRALLKNGKVELTFSEPVSTTGLAAAVTIDGASISWTTSTDGLIAATADALPAGTHQVEISTGAIDLAGKGLAEPMTLNLTVPSAERRDLAGVIQLLYERANPREVPQSPTGQRASFQGHPVDEETGFVYLRNRYFDPEMGRFITADPLGNVDGPSEYAFGAGDWVNGRDPMGTCDPTRSRIPCLEPGLIRQIYDENVSTMLSSRNDIATRALAAVNVILYVAPAGLEDIGRGMLNAPHSGVVNSREGGEHLAKATLSQDALVRAKEYSYFVGNVASAFVDFGGIGVPVAAVPEHLANRELRRLSGLLNKEVYERAAAISAEESAAYLPRSKRGPVLTGVMDTQTGEIFFGLNQREIPADLHPILRRNLDEYLKRTGGITPEKAGVPGTHSEIIALDAALKAREARLGTQLSAPDLQGFLLANRALLGQRRVSGIPPRCANCSAITDGVRPIGGTE